MLTLIFYFNKNFGGGTVLYKDQLSLHLFLSKEILFLGEESCFPSLIKFSHKTVNSFSNIYTLYRIFLCTNIYITHSLSKYSRHNGCLHVGLPIFFPHLYVDLKVITFIWWSLKKMLQDFIHAIFVIFRMLAALVAMQRLDQWKIWEFQKNGLHCTSVGFN